MKHVPVLLSGKSVLRNMLSPFLYVNHEHRMTDTSCIFLAASYRQLDITLLYPSRYAEEYSRGNLKGR
jgi:hypothetical protein